MASRRYQHPEVGEYVVNKRRGMRRIKLSIAHDGTVRVTMPLWAPLSQAHKFVDSQQDWLKAHRPQANLISDGQIIGRSRQFRVVLTDNTRIATRLTQNAATLSLPKNLNITDATVQDKAKALIIRSLKEETKERIVPRLELLSSTFLTPFSSVSIKSLTSRWGSCSSKNDITLSCFLAQLPDEVVDYVLIHELTHTEVHAHNKAFWDRVAARDSQYRQHRKQLKTYRPVLELMS